LEDEVTNEVTLDNLEFSVEDAFVEREGFSRLIIDYDFFTKVIPRQMINFILNDTNDTIYLIINSDGGALFNLVVLMSLLKKYKHLVAINLGEAYSAAGLLFFLADERYISPEGLVMLHQYRTKIDGDMVDIESYNNAMKRLFKLLFKKIGKKISIQETYFFGEDLIKNNEAKPITTEFLQGLI